MNIADRMWDVVIIGGGPGGAASAAFLAKGGLSVLVLERDAFPRFHIGESLLPSGFAVLQHLGVPIDEETFVFKRGAQFICDATDRVAEFDFQYALEGQPRHAWHVERASFDTLLCEHARQSGATIEHGVTVKDFEIDAHGVTLETDAGTVRGRYLIDASGQQRFMAKKKRAVVPYMDFGRASVFTHFHDVQQHAWDVIAPNYDIRIMMVRDGWMWVIPLPGRRLSVGLVSRRQGIKEAWLDEYIGASKRITAWTAGARRDETHIIANFSYKNREPFGERYVCVGDAACFLDPVFSSGVNLALRSAESVSAHLLAGFAEGREGDPALMEAHAERQERAYDTFSALIFRFYHTKIIDNLIFDVPDAGALRAHVTSVFTGDVFRSDNPFQEMLLSSRIRPRAGESLLKGRSSATPDPAS